MVRGAVDATVAALAGIPPAQLASVSRLFVEPAARARGVGAALLNSVSDWASRWGLRLMLDVVENGTSAVALYERLGWTLVDRRLTPQGNRLPLRSYLAPSPQLIPAAVSPTAEPGS